MNKWFSGALALVGILIGVFVSAAGAPPPPGGPPAPAADTGGGAVGPVGIPQVQSLSIDPVNSWIEWRSVPWGEQAYINSSNPDAKETIFRSGSLGKMVVSERRGTTFFVRGYIPFALLTPWQKELFADSPMRVEFLPGVKVLVQDQWGVWHQGGLEDIGDSFSIGNGFPTPNAIYPLEVSVP